MELCLLERWSASSCLLNYKMPLQPGNCTQLPPHLQSLVNVNIARLQKGTSLQMLARTILCATEAGTTPQDS